MAATPEGKVKTQIRKILNKHKAFIYAPQAGQFGKAGIPDFLCCVNGKFIAIEAKAFGNKPTEIQMSVMRKIADAGGTSLIITERNYDTLEQTLADASSQ